ncbi:extracellular calcium-sensing receptor-like [Microcaecilia unicolor]|uniref:Extracellular calcium-sensing receptor-like n=1 Tax=Microcaecilia unicolor TaxID=1415580 RepID=A0A6P7WPJ9_9AMPH|nr:extracellular calcium-sensing receptor-like [Microcaecilia unicolor]
MTSFMPRQFDFQSYQWLQALRFAIEEVNASPGLLPNVTLGFSMVNSCGMPTKGLEGTLWLLSGEGQIIPNFQCSAAPPLVAVIGGASSYVSRPMAYLLGLYGYPQISYFATIPLLSDRHLFPSFFRTIPSDEAQFKGLAHLLMHFDWTWVGILASAENYGQLGSQLLKEEIIQAGGCVAFLEPITTTYSMDRVQHIVSVVKKSQVKVIVVIAYVDYVSPVLEEASRQNVTGKVWVASEAWSISRTLADKNLQNTLEGTIGFAIRKGEIPGLREFLIGIHPSSSSKDIFIKEFWEKTFKCFWESPNIPRVKGAKGGQTEASHSCTRFEDLGDLNTTYTDVSKLRITYNIYNAVYAVSHALQDLHSCQPGTGPFTQRSCADIFHVKPWQSLHYLKRVHFKNTANEELFFDERGNPPPVYDILNWQVASNGQLEFVKIGSYEGQNLILNKSAIVWNGRRKEVPRSICSDSCPPGHQRVMRQGEPPCCFDCTPCSPGEIANETDSHLCTLCPEEFWSNIRRNQCVPKPVDFLSYEEPLGMILTAVVIVLSFLLVGVLLIFVRNHETPIVKANHRELSYLLLLALLLSFLCTLMFIGRPLTSTCMVRQIAFSLIFTLCVSCVLAKTLMVVIAFNATKPGNNSRKWVGSRLPNTVISFSMVLPVLIYIVWLYNTPPFLERNINSQPGKITLECNEGSSLAFWCLFGYMGFLAGVSFLVAFLARKLPDSFNEAKYITFSMLIFGSVWASFVPAYLSTKGKNMVAVEIFAILASSGGLLACMFFPKCYIILLKPSMNTREHLMGKGTHRMKKGKHQRN